MNAPTILVITASLSTVVILITLGRYVLYMDQVLHHARDLAESVDRERQSAGELTASVIENEREELHAEMARLRAALAEAEKQRDDAIRQLGRLSGELPPPLRATPRPSPTVGHAPPSPVRAIQLTALAPAQPGATAAAAGGSAHRAGDA